jgi:glutamate-cysteine ligase
MAKPFEQPVGQEYPNHEQSLHHDPARGQRGVGPLSRRCNSGGATAVRPMFGYPIIMSFDELPTIWGEEEFLLVYAEAAIAVSNYLRPWLPLLLALTANSTIYRNAESRYASLRSVLWAPWPSAGPPPYFESVGDYDATVQMRRDA